MMYRCDNCGKLFKPSKVIKINSEELSARNEEGAPFREHECPSCGCAVYPYFDPFAEGIEQVDVVAWHEELAKNNANFVLQAHEIDWEKLFREYCHTGQSALEFKVAAENMLPDERLAVRADSLLTLVESIEGLLRIIKYVQDEAAKQVIGHEMVFGYEEE